MKRILLVLWINLIVISCGKVTPKGNIENKDIQVEDFSNLNLQGKFKVFFVTSPNNFVNVETYENVAKNLKINVSDKTLNIVEKRETQGVDFYNITVYSKYNPEKISVSDSVELNISGEIKTDNFTLNLKNNAKFIGALNSRRAAVEMQNTSRANFTGKTKDALIKIADTAHIIAPYWVITNLDLQAKNGSYTEVDVKDTLKGNIQNTSKLLFYNDPVRRFKADKTAKIENKELD